MKERIRFALEDTLQILRGNIKDKQEIVDLDAEITDILKHDGKLVKYQDPSETEGGMVILMEALPVHRAYIPDVQRVFCETKSQNGTVYKHDTFEVYMAELEHYGYIVEEEGNFYQLTEKGRRAAELHQRCQLTHTRPRARAPVR